MVMASEVLFLMKISEYQYEIVFLGWRLRCGPGQCDFEEPTQTGKNVAGRYAGEVGYPRCRAETSNLAVQAARAMA